MVVLRERDEQARPVEARAGIALASGRDVAVRGDVAQMQLLQKRCEGGVLRGREAILLGALELDADGEVVAALARAPARHAGVPGALAELISSISFLILSISHILARVE